MSVSDSDGTIARTTCARLFVTTRFNIAMLGLLTGNTQVAILDWTEEAFLLSLDPVQCFGCIDDTEGLAVLLLSYLDLSSLSFDSDAESNHKKGLQAKVSVIQLLKHSGPFAF